MKKISFVSSICILSILTLCACGKKNKDAVTEVQEVTDVQESVEESSEDTEAQTVDDDSEALIKFPGADDITVVCPEGYVGIESAQMDKCIEFNPKDSDSVDDYYEMSISLFEAEDKDEYLEKGQYKAEIFMKKLLLDKVAELYEDYVYSYTGCNFWDGDTFWGITGFICLDGTMFEPETEEELYSAIEIRYYGPDNCFVMTKVTALEINISDHYQASHNMIDTVVMPEEWNNCPKDIPDISEVPEEKNWIKADRSTKKLSVIKAVCDEETDADCSEPFFWCDKDKDIWFCNGITNEFVGFGSDIKVENGAVCSLKEGEWEYDGTYEFEYCDYYDPWDNLGYDAYFDMFDGYYEYYDGEGFDDDFDDEDFDDEDWDDEEWLDEDDTDDEDFDDEDWSDDDGEDDEDDEWSDDGDWDDGDWIVDEDWSDDEGDWEED